MVTKQATKWRLDGRTRKRRKIICALQYQYERNGTNELWYVCHKKKYEVIRAPQYQYDRDQYYSNELWYAFPYHLQANNTRNISMVNTPEKRR